MPVMLYDGAASAANMPPETVALLDRYGDTLCHLAVTLQRGNGTALTDLLGFIIEDDVESIAGVAPASDLVGDLRDAMHPARKATFDGFMTEQTKPSQLRVICWDERGFFLLRVDTIRPPKAGMA